MKFFCCRLDAKSQIAPSQKPRLKPAAGGHKQTVDVRWPPVRHNRRVIHGGGGGASRHDDGSISGGDYDYVDTAEASTAASVNSVNSLVRGSSQAVKRRHRPPYQRLPHHQKLPYHRSKQWRTKHHHQFKSPPPPPSRQQQLQHTRRGDFDNAQFYPVGLIKRQ